MANEKNMDVVPGSSFVSAFEELRLNALINDRTSNVHRIDEDIEKLEQALLDIDRAIDAFNKAADEMQMLEAEVALVFKGESAAAFMRKIIAYKNYCLRRINHMETLKANYKKQIKDLELQKTIAQNLINILKDRLEKIRRSNICIM